MPGGRAIADSPGPQTGADEEELGRDADAAGGVFGGSRAMHVPLYASVASSSPSPSPPPPSGPGSAEGSAASSGTSTPALGHSAPGSRRGSDEHGRHHSHQPVRLQQLLAPLQAQPPLPLPLGMQPVTLRRVNDGVPMNLPPGLPRGSFIQHVRVAQPAAAAAPTSASDSSSSSSGMLMSRTGVPGASGAPIRMRNLDDPSPIVRADLCVSPSAPIDSDVLERVFSPSP